MDLDFKARVDRGGLTDGWVVGGVIGWEGREGFERESVSIRKRYGYDEEQTEVGDIPINGVLQ